MTEDKTRKRPSENPETEAERRKIEKDYRDMQKAIAREQEKAEPEGLTYGKDEFEKTTETFWKTSFGRLMQSKVRGDDRSTVF